MPVQRYKPTSPGRRRASRLISEVTKHRPEKALLQASSKNAGRNVQGKITVRHRGGGHKRYYRTVDFRQDKYDYPAQVVGIEYDPNRSANVALLQYADGEKRYVLAPAGLKPGDTIIASRGAVEIRVGNRTTLERIPTGWLVHNVELEPGRGGVLMRAAGAGAQLLTVEGRFAHLKLPSGEVRLVPKDSFASLGQVGNIDYGKVRLGKAGKRRWRGFRPSVRGKAMNPVDHPHGGGEGNQPIGMKYPKTPWGKHALGVKTRRPKPSDRLILKRRR